MPNLYFFPCVDPGAEIIPEKQYIPPSGGLYGYIVLETGVTVALSGDYTSIHCGVGYPDENGDFLEYEEIGWTLSRNTYTP